MAYECIMNAQEDLNASGKKKLLFKAHPLIALKAYQTGWKSSEAGICDMHEGLIIWKYVKVYNRTGSFMEERCNKC